MKQKHIGILLGLVAVAVGMYMNNPVGWFIIVVGVGIAAKIASVDEREESDLWY